MTLSMRRIVLFTKDMPGMIAFYRDVLDLSLLKDEPGRKELDANGCVIALHNGSSHVGKRPPEIGFWSSDVASAREALTARGAKLSKIVSGRALTRCEGKKPDGNPFSISNGP